MSHSRAAFDRELVAALPMLQHRASRLCMGTPLDPDDVVQASVVRMLEKWTTFIPGSSFGAWSFTILRNMRHDMARRSIAAPFTELSPTIEDTIGTPPCQATRLEIRDMLSALAKCRSEPRKLLIESVVNKVTVPELASRLGCAEGTVKSRMSRARVQLRQAVAC